MGTSTTFPDPPPHEQLDAPPADLVAQWLPELSEEHTAALRAVAAEREARERFGAAFPRGADWVAAEKADAAAVGRKRKAEQLAELIRSQPERYGDWVARSLHAAKLVGVWNAHAYEKVGRESRERLIDEVARLEGGIAEAAVLVVDVAASLPGDEQARTRAAWKRLVVIDELGDAWRTVQALLSWVSWSRPIVRGRAFETLHADAWPQPMHEEGVASVLGRALALRDGELREQLERLRPAARAR